MYIRLLLLVWWLSPFVAGANSIRVAEKRRWVPTPRWCARPLRAGEVCGPAPSADVTWEDTASSSQQRHKIGRSHHIPCNIRNQHELSFAWNTKVWLTTQWRIEDSGWGNTDRWWPIISSAQAPAMGPGWGPPKETVFRAWHLRH